MSRLWVITKIKFKKKNRAFFCPELGLRGNRQMAWEGMEHIRQCRTTETSTVIPLFITFLLSLAMLRQCTKFRQKSMTSSISTWDHLNLR